MRELGAGTFGLGALLSLLLTACVDGERSNMSLSTTSCAVRAQGSRWVPVRGAYAYSAEFGREIGADIVDPWGVAATPNGDLFVYDGGSTRVVRLNANLEVIAAFGRAGQGPGEFTYQRVGQPNWITADDTSVFVLDLRALSVFDTGGTFVGYGTRRLPFVVPITRIAARSGEVVYASDVINSRNGRRALETRRLGPDSSVLLRIDSMPGLPSWRGHYVHGALVYQADPLWALEGRCAFVSDGAGDWILRIDLTTNQADTMRLPHRAVPVPSKDDERQLRRIRGLSAMAAGIRGDWSVEPTARMKWDNLLVDPDGFVWLEPWRPLSSKQRPFHAWVIHPGTGAVDSVLIDEFPAVFLPRGAFAAVAYDTADGVFFIKKYALAEPDAKEDDKQ